MLAARTAISPGRSAEGDAAGDRRQRVGQVVGLGEGEAKSAPRRRGADERLGSRRQAPAARNASTSPPAPKRSSRGARSRCGSSSPASTGCDHDAVGGQGVDHRRLLRRDRRHRAHLLDVDGADVGDDRRVGLGDRRPARRSDRAPRIAISRTSDSVSSGASRIVSGSPISVLKFCGWRARGPGKAPGRCP